MTDIFTNRTSDYDGSPAGLNEVQVASGSVLVTLSGTLGTTKRQPVLTMYSRSGAVDYAPTYQQRGFGRKILDIALTDDYYFIVSSIESDASVDLGVADV